MVGLNASGRDWAAWTAEFAEDLILRSQLSLFRDIGVFLFGDTRHALDFAMSRIALPDPKPTLNQFANTGVQRHLFDYFDGGIEAAQ